MSENNYPLKKETPETIQAYIHKKGHTALGNRVWVCRYTQDKKGRIDKMRPTPVMISVNIKRKHAEYEAIQAIAEMTKENRNNLLHEKIQLTLWSKEKGLIPKSRFQIQQSKSDDESTFVFQSKNDCLAFYQDIKHQLKHKLNLKQ